MTFFFRPGITFAVDRPLLRKCLAYTYQTRKCLVYTDQARKCLAYTYQARKFLAYIPIKLWSV